MALRKETTHLVIHCAATKPSQDWGVKEIDRMHRARGFFKIGYHFVIRRNGVLEVGREELEVGAHCKDGGMNRCSIGICLVGGISARPQKHVAGNPWNGSDAQNNFTEDQWLALFTLTKHLIEKYPGVQIIGHRDVMGVAKACPSFDVGKWLAKAFPDE